MRRYRVVGETPLQVRRVRYVEGEALELEPAIGEPLVDRGRLKPLEHVEKTTEGGAGGVQAAGAIAIPSPPAVRAAGGQRPGAGAAPPPEPMHANGEVPAGYDANRHGQETDQRRGGPGRPGANSPAIPPQAPRRRQRPAPGR